MDIFSHSPLQVECGSSDGLFISLFTHGPQRWNHGSSDGLFLLLLLLLLLHTTNFGGWVGLYCTVLCTVLYCTVLYCTVLYCTVLYCTVLYCTVLYCTVLYCIVLYCTVKKKKKSPPPKKTPLNKKNHPPPKKKSPPKKSPPPPKKNVQNKGGLNCTVDRGSCAADALLFFFSSTPPTFHRLTFGLTKPLMKKISSELLGLEHQGMVVILLCHVELIMTWLTMWRQSNNLQPAVQPKLR